MSYALDYRKHIEIDPWRRSGKPCIRNTRIAVFDILEYLASGMTPGQIVEDFPELTEQDVFASLLYAADRKRRVVGA